MSWKGVFLALPALELSGRGRFGKLSEFVGPLFGKLSELVGPLFGKLSEFVGPLFVDRSISADSATGIRASEGPLWLSFAP